MSRLAGVAGVLSVSVILGVSTVSGCGCLQLYGCGDTGNPPAQHGTTRAIFNGLSGSWKTNGLYGYVDTPKFPVSINATGAEISYMAIVTGNPVGTTPWPINDFVVKSFGYLGPPGGTFDSWNDPNASFTSWNEHPGYPGKRVTFPFGSYIAGKNGLGNGTTDRVDLMFGQADLWYGASSTKHLALATLTWKFNPESSNILGSANTVWVGEGLWIQATADLPEPITYSWSVNGAGQSWNDSYVWAVFTQSGPKAITATMTGANSASVQRTWSLSVQCPPPADPYAINCDP